MAHEHSYAAFSPDDVDDAARGCPAGALDGWADGRGLDHRIRELPAPFASVLPAWPEHLFELCVGELGPGRFGLVAQELAEVALDSAGAPTVPGPYAALHVAPRPKRLLGRVGFEARRSGGDPFAARAAWAPVTQVAVRVPEAVLLPTMTVRNADRVAPEGNPSLEADGLAGFRMVGSDAVSDGLRRAVAGALRPLAALDAPFVAVHARFGIVAVSRNGFVFDGAILDDLVAVALDVADGIADLGRSLTWPQPFADPLPAPNPALWPPGWLEPTKKELELLTRVTRDLGMVQEDPVAFHRAHPRSPVPGRAVGVVRGRIPRTSIEGRVGLYVSTPEREAPRPVVMVSARPRVETPLGGIHDRATGVRAEVADGVAYAWSDASTSDPGDVAPRVAEAVATLRRFDHAEL